MMFTAAPAQPYYANTGLEMTPCGVNNGYRGDPYYSGNQGSTPNKNDYESGSAQPYVAYAGQEMHAGGDNSGTRGDPNDPRHQVCGAQDSDWSLRGAQHVDLRETSHSSNSVTHAATRVASGIIVAIVIACLIAGIIVTIIVCCVCCARRASRRPTTGDLVQPIGQIVVTAASAQAYVANTGMELTTQSGELNGIRSDPNYPGHQVSTSNKNDFESASAQPYVANTGLEMTTQNGVNNGYRGDPNYPGLQVSILNKNDFESSAVKPYVANTGQETTNTKRPCDRKSQEQAKSVPHHSKTTLLIGDSILEGIHLRGCHSQVEIELYPGKKLGNIMHILRNMNLRDCDNVVIYAGGNDAANGNSIDTLYDELLTAIRTLKTAVNIYICTVCPRHDANVIPVNGMLKQVCEDMSVTLIDCYQSFIYGDGSTVEKMYDNDGIHLSPKGSSLLVASINSVIPIIKSRSRQQRLQRRT